MVGTHYEIEQLVELLLRDREYYEASGGGVTLSGGEPTFYMDYVSRLLCSLRGDGIQTAIETAGYFHYESFKSKVLSFLSLILYDIKLMGSEEHRRYTGRGNQIILDNFHRLLEDSSVPIIPRIPLIPGITTRPDNLQAISEFIKDCGLTQCWLLPYNPLGLSKRENIGKGTVDLPRHWMSEEECKRCKRIFAWAMLIDASDLVNQV
jgi:pyruvate formate lyase activating enzyme